MAVEVSILYNSGDFPILYYVLLAILMYVFDFVCFIPSKSLIVAIPSVSVVGYIPHCTYTL